MPLIKVDTALHSREGVNLLDRSGNSPDLNPIEEVWIIVIKKSGKLPNNKKKLWNNICNLYIMVRYS